MAPIDLRLWSTYVNLSRMKDFTRIENPCKIAECEQWVGVLFKPPKEAKNGVKSRRCILEEEGTE